MLDFVRRLDNSVFFGLPKCAWNGGILVTLFGISRMDSIISKIFSAMVVLSHMGSKFMVASPRFNVFIRRSTMPDSRWSWVGMNISFLFFFFAEDFKCSRFKCPCLITADATWYSIILAVLVDKFYCCLCVAVCYYC